MINIKFYDLKKTDKSLLKRVVIVCTYNGKFVFCKHKDRSTYELPGGHIELNEDPFNAAKRELFEETGATKYDIEEICSYFLSDYALLCYANIKEFSKLPNFEIEKIELFDEMPNNLTYKEMHIALLNKVKEIKNL